MYKHMDRIFFFDRLLLLYISASRGVFPSDPAGLISLGISSELRFRVSRSLCFHLDVSDIPLVQ